MSWPPFRRQKTKHNRPTQAENPGRGIELDLSFSRDDRTWSETGNVVKELHGILRNAGHNFQQADQALIDPETGLVFQPQFVEFDLTENSAVQTTTTIEVSHPERLAKGVFEYQHSTAHGLIAALQSGFEQWATADLPVLRDAFLPEPRECVTMDLSFDGTAAIVPHHRRVLVGPVISYAQYQVQPAEDEHPPFCTCCFFSHTSKAFQDLLESNDFYAIRFFAMREEEPSADCRVNGIDHEAGESALIEFAKSWRDRGMEFRKQLVVIQSV